MVRINVFKFSTNKIKQRLRHNKREIMKDKYINFPSAHISNIGFALLKSNIKDAPFQQFYEGKSRHYLLATLPPLAPTSSQTPLRISYNFCL